MYHSELQFSHLTDYLTPDNTKGFSTNSIFYIKVVNFMNLVQDWTKFVSFKYIIPFILSFSVFGDPLQLFSFDYTGMRAGGVCFILFSFLYCVRARNLDLSIFLYFSYFYWILEIACINQSICSTSKMASYAKSNSLLKFSNSLFICFYSFIYFWISSIKSINVAV